MDDATASDNCRSHYRCPAKHRGDARQLVIVRTFTAPTCWKQSGRRPSLHHSAGVHLPLRTTPLLDEMPMDDATASTTAESHHRGVQRNHAGDAAGNYVIVRTFTATDDAGTALRLRRPSPWRTPQRRVHLRPCRLHRRVLDEMPMDDATASDNCGSHHRGVQRNHRRRCAGNYVIVRTFTATDDAGNSSSASQTITVEDTTAPEFTFVPADYTVECSTRCRWTTPRRQTTAEVTIEVSSETTAGDAAGNYVIVRTFTATDDAGNSSRLRRPSPWRTPQRRSSPSSLPTTP